MSEILLLIENKISPYLSELNLELIDLEYVCEGGYNYLRIYIESIDKETTLDDCISLSTKIDPIIDNLIDERYYLEVSTPGLERKLKKSEDFLRFLNRDILVKTKSNINDKKRFEGTLLDFNNNNIYILDKNLNKKIEIGLEKIKIAKLIYNLSDQILKETNYDLSSIK